VRAQRLVEPGTVARARGFRSDRERAGGHPGAAPADSLVAAVLRVRGAARGPAWIHAPDLGRAPRTSGGHAGVVARAPDPPRASARWRLPGLPAQAAAPQPDEPPPATFDRAQVVLFVRAAGISLAISLLAMALAVPLGLLLALARLYGGAPARLLAHGYIELF